LIILPIPIGLPLVYQALDLIRAARNPKEKGSWERLIAGGSAPLFEPFRE